MEFLQKHFEKILLTLALAVSGVVVYFLLSSINESKSLVAEAEESPRPRRVSEYEATPIEPMNTELKRFEEPVEAVLGSGEHKVVNPEKWVRTRDGRLIPEAQAGVAGLTIEVVRPLKTTIAYHELRGSGDSARHYFKVALQASQDVQRRRERSRSLELQKPASDHPFILTAVEGPATNPSTIRLELVVDEESPRVPIALGLENSFAWEKVEGYAADLYHEPSNQRFSDKRVDEVVRINGANYEIVSVTPEEIALQAEKGERYIVSLSN